MPLADTCSFHKVRIITDMIFVVCLHKKKYGEQHRDLYITFVNLAKAFNAVKRDMFWRILAKCGYPLKFIAII